MLIVRRSTCYSFYLGRHVVDGETLFSAAPQVTCRLAKLLFSVEQPMPRWRRRRRPLGRGMIREHKVKHRVRLEQIRVAGTVMFIEGERRRIGNGSMIDRGGFPLVMFEPHSFMSYGDLFIAKDTPVELRLYGSSYGLTVTALALVEAPPAPSAPQVQR